MRQSVRWRLDAGRRSSSALASALIVVIFAIFVFLCLQGFGTTIEQAKAKAQTAADIVAPKNRTGCSAAALTALQPRSPAACPTALDPTRRATGTIDAALEGVCRPSAASALYDADGDGVAGTASRRQSAPSIADTPALRRSQQGHDFAVLPQRETPTRRADDRRGAAAGRRQLRAAWRCWPCRDVAARDVLGAAAPRARIRPSTCIATTAGMVGRYPPLAGSAQCRQTRRTGRRSRQPDAAPTITRSPIDGVTRVVGFRHCRDLGIVVFATVSQDAALAGLWSSIIIVLLADRRRSRWRCWSAR